MPGSLQARIKTWVSTEDVVYSDLNAEFDNVLTAMQPLLVDDYSTNVTQMQVQTDPGEVATESLATTLGGEIARLRFMIKELSGENYWYESPDASIASLVNAIGTGLLNNRIVSGRIRSSSDQPIFLVANGAARTVKLDGTPTNFVYYVNGVQYTISTDITLTNLTAAPSANNTTLINDVIAAADPEYSKHTGENGTEIPIDAAGSEITALVGKFAAFRLAGFATEYFIAYVDSSTRLTKAMRGYFFDSADAPIVRSAYTDNDVITLMKLSWIYAKTDGTLTVSYTNPTYSDDEPTSPASNDYWFDTSANKWKRYDVSSFTDANATLVGVCIQDATNTVAARSFHFFANYGETNTVEIISESNSQVKSRYPGSQIAVIGTTYRYDNGLITWDMTLDLESGVTEAASTYYYFYITEDGDKLISDKRPFDRREDLNGWYHPHQSWRCVGQAYNDGSSNLGNIESFYNRDEHVLIVPSQTVASNVEIVERIIRLDASGGAFTKYLPAAALCRGAEFILIKTDSSLTAITIDAFGSETINGSTTTTLNTQYEAIRIISDGSAWHILERRIPATLTSYTSTYENFGTVASPQAQWSRSGKYIHVDASYTTGTVAGGTASMSLPSGLNIDTTNISGVYLVGFNGNNSGVAPAHIIASTATSTTKVFFSTTIAATTAIAGSTSPFASGQLHINKFSVAISEWKA